MKEIEHFPHYVSLNYPKESQVYIDQNWDQWTPQFFHFLWKSATWIRSGRNLVKIYLADLFKSNALKSIMAAFTRDWIRVNVAYILCCPDDSAVCHS